MCLWHLYISETIHCVNGDDGGGDIDDDRTPDWIIICVLISQTQHIFKNQWTMNT